MSFFILHRLNTVGTCLWCCVCLFTVNWRVIDKVERGCNWEAFTVCNGLACTIAERQVKLLDIFLTNAANMSRSKEMIQVELCENLQIDNKQENKKRRSDATLKVSGEKFRSAFVPVNQGSVSSWHHFISWILWKKCSWGIAGHSLCCCYATVKTPICSQPLAWY